MTTVQMIVLAQGAFVAELQGATVEELRKYAADLETVARLYQSRRDLVLKEIRRRGKDGRRERPRATPTTRLAVVSDQVEEGGGDAG